MSLFSVSPGKISLGCGSPLAPSTRENLRSRLLGTCEETMVRLIHRSDTNVKVFLFAFEEQVKVSKSVVVGLHKIKHKDRVRVFELAFLQ